MNSRKNPVLSAENWSDSVILMMGNHTSIGFHLQNCKQLLWKEGDSSTGVTI